MPSRVQRWSGAAECARELEGGAGADGGSTGDIRGQSIRQTSFLQVQVNPQLRPAHYLPGVERIEVMALRLLVLSAER